MVSSSDPKNLFGFNFLSSCNKNPKIPEPLKVALCGNESYAGAALRPYVELFSTKSTDWQNYIKFYVVPLGEFVRINKKVGLNLTLVCNVHPSIDSLRMSFKTSVKMFTLHIRIYG